MVFASIVSLFVSLFYMSQEVTVGAEQLDRLLPMLEGKRVSLVVNQTSMCGNSHLLDTLIYKGIDVVKVFAPEHGFRGKADAGETVQDGKDSKTGVPIVSLYGQNKKPTAVQLGNTDIVVFDIQDVGARFYTYISTMFYVMQSCAEFGKSMVVLDRPNPCDYVDGPVREAQYKSFVGMLPIPILHGCTVGELAKMINGEGWLGNGLKCKLDVIRVKGWKHGQAYSLPIKPSPNLPNDQAISLYASLCPFEGTSVSVGRGTVFPFQMIGTPYTKRETGFSFIPESLEGFDKNPLHKGVRCYGDDLRSVSSPKGFSLKYVIEYYKAYVSASCSDKFFTRTKMFDLLMGTNKVRLAIIEGRTENEIRLSWEEGLERYRIIRGKYLLY